MYEIDFFAVGEGEKSGDAITLRYTLPDFTDPIVGIIDAGFQPNGEALVEHITGVYGTDKVDFVISTHPDEDHINGMGIVMRNLNVRYLLIHRPAAHGYGSNSGSEPAEELAELAKAQRTRVIEPFTGVEGFGDSLLIAGPNEQYYEEMLEVQTETVKESAYRPSLAGRFLGTTVTKAAQKVFLAAFPVEIPFSDAGGTNPRNNSSAVVSLMIDGRHLILPGDAGVPALGAAMDFLDERDRTKHWPALFVLPHHGSRHNLDLDTIQRILGSHTDDHYGAAIASVSEESDNPSPRVANAAGRRGYPVYATAGTSFRIAHDAPPRDGWSGTVESLGPLDESDDHDD